MHIAMVTGIGLVLLGACHFGAGLFGASRQGGARWFIWFWLVAALVNGGFGVLRAGIPVINEIGAFIPIFGIPAAIAWYLAYRR